ncbi:hypothetical protein CHLRE_16g681352v5 [Chlamydomonas reinhardtii]|uniref:Uncharacterized protein n=1 Tax=Chlamydomonas reinhardtii TaxID=3055 RepID=A0A2K3CV17_CHLRE|nr:uncharacterized protein CHLRE_16g681352v5 [Chlamydomonas reinhardtii]PNW72129.1 hypothetical protein CHLRE_16g681352v5 [Chlamydomonas reinhardtii]
MPLPRENKEFLAPASTAHQRRTVLPYGSAVARPPQARRINGGRCCPTAPLWQGLRKHGASTADGASLRLRFGKVGCGSLGGLGNLWRQADGKRAERRYTVYLGHGYRKHGRA